MKLVNGMPVDTEQRRVYIICEIFFGAIAQPKDVADAKLAARVVAASDAAAGYALTLGANIGADAFGLDILAESGTTTDFRRADALAQHLYGLGYKALGDDRCGFVYELAKAIRKYDAVAGFSLVKAGGQQ
ncbi:MAG: hypothetical protein KF895_02535 [Parvibaculum sp.]|nr:hypothetical protein [Parvibaculum sp.]